MLTKIVITYFQYFNYNKNNLLFIIYIKFTRCLTEFNIFIKNKKFQISNAYKMNLNMYYQNVIMFRKL